MRRSKWSVTVDKGGALVVDPAAQQVVAFYQSSFGRLPDSDGLATWTSIAHGGINPSDMANAFFESSEFQTAHGSQSDQDYISALYEMSFSRAPDAAGEHYWMDELASGQVTRAGLLGLFATSPEEMSRVQSLISVDLSAWHVH